jgi:hypothetical protein
MCVVLAVMLMDNVQKHTCAYITQLKELPAVVFSETLPLIRIDVIIIFMHFSDSIKQYEFSMPPRLFDIHHVIKPLKIKVQM